MASSKAFAKLSARVSRQAEPVLNSQPAESSPSVVESRFAFGVDDAGWISEIQFVHEGSELWVEAGGRLQAWDLKTLSKRQRLAAYLFALSPDGKHIVTMEGAGTGKFDASVSVWNLSDGSLASKVQFPTTDAHFSPVDGRFAVLSNGRLVVATSVFGYRVLDLQTRQQRGGPDGSPGFAAIAGSDDGSFAVLARFGVSSDPSPTFVILSAETLLSSK
jgi:WD40 repeat protein